MNQQADIMVACAKDYPRCLHGNMGGVGYAVPALECACHVSREASLAGRSIYPVDLLPDVREAIEGYAREHSIPVTTAIAEACRAFVGLSE